MIPAGRTEVRAGRAGTRPAVPGHGTGGTLAGGRPAARESVHHTPTGTEAMPDSIPGRDDVRACTHAEAREVVRTGHSRP